MSAERKVSRHSNVSSVCPTVQVADDSQEEISDGVNDIPTTVQQRDRRSGVTTGLSRESYTIARMTNSSAQSERRLSN